MFYAFQLDRGNIPQANSDNFLANRDLTTNNYNYGSNCHSCWLKFPLNWSSRNSALITGNFYMLSSPTQTASWFHVKKGWLTKRGEIILVTRVIRDDASKGYMRSYHLEEILDNAH